MSLIQLGRQSTAALLFVDPPFHLSINLFELTTTSPSLLWQIGIDLH
jgi:16S rRNA G966 N2-methylase RsmD